MQFNGASQMATGEPLSIDVIAHRLWELLDEIDTLDDMIKSDDAAFRKRVYEIQQKRWQYASTDGYTLQFNVK
jgi:hypothetical protein